MKITLQKDPVDYLIVEDYYSRNETDAIMRELLYYQANDKLKTPNYTASATENGLPKKQNKSVFLNTIYNDKSMSDILNINRKTYEIFSKDFNTDRYKGSWFFNTIVPTADFTLLNYYDDNDNYKSHVDTSVATCISFFYKKPKKWTGGDLIFSDYNFKIKPEFGKMIVFPSMIRHEVTPVKMEKGYESSNFGRFTISQFIETSHAIS